MTTHYLAFTLGPIYNTLKQARKTRELWAASYIFSALMRELLEALKVHSVLAQNEQNLLAPRVHLMTKKGAGIYPDRCYLTIPEKVTGDKIQNIIDTALGQVSNLIPKQTPAFNPAEQFRVYAAQISSADTQASVLLRLNTILDALELRPIVPRSDSKLVSVLEENIQNLYQDAGKNAVFITFDHGRQQRLPSLLELATAELNTGAQAKIYENELTEPTNQAVLEYQRRSKTEKNDKKAVEKHEADAQENALLALKAQFGDAVKFRHKYVCFVKADGDNIGKTLEAVGNNPTGIQDFSQALGRFAAAAVDKIEAYGAIPVYAGGDDLLFIAPVQNAGGKQHVFNLLAEIDAVFPSGELEALGKSYNPDFNARLSLSYGLSVSYYKFPMFESLDAMDDLLFGAAKHFPNKNAVAFRVLKHSGQAFGTTFSKSGEAFATFSSLLVACRAQDSAFLTSVMHKLSELKPFLEDALTNDLCAWFFKHHFNENDHSTNEAQRYIQTVRQLCEQTWSAEKQRAEQAQSIPEVGVVTGQIYAALRFVQFLNQEDHD